MPFQALCQIDADPYRTDEFDRMVRKGPWMLATLDGLLARRQAPFSAVLVHDDGRAIERTLKRIAQEGGTIAVIGYHENIAPAAIVDALFLGALDYLSWPIDPASLDARLELAAQRAMRRQGKPSVTPDERKALSRLSRRESEVLAHISSGATTKIIARDLGVSPRTVEVHRMNILNKLGVENAIGAASIHMRAELISESLD